MNSGRDAALQALQGVVGPRHVLTDPALLAGALVEPRGLYRGKALALVRPGSTAEVAAIAAFCPPGPEPITSTSKSYIFPV